MADKCNIYKEPIKISLEETNQKLKDIGLDL